MFDPNPERKVNFDQEIENAQIEVYEKWQGSMTSPKKQISALKKQLYVNNLVLEKINQNSKK